MAERLGDNPGQLRIGLLHHTLYIRCRPDPHGNGSTPPPDKMTISLYEDPSTNCSHYSYETNFTHVPESILASVHSSGNCTWLENIITGNYSTQDVWRDLLPATIYNPNFTNCYSEQYMEYFGLSDIHDREYSYQRGWLIPRGLSSLAESCYTSACRGSGATGNPDIAGIGVSWFSEEMPSCLYGYLPRDNKFGYRCWLHTRLNLSL